MFEFFTLFDFALGLLDKVVTLVTSVVLAVAFLKKIEVSLLALDGKYSAHILF